MSTHPGVLIRSALVGSAVLVALLQGCKPKPNAYVPPPPPEVTVARPTEQVVKDLFETTGILRALESVEIRARVRGFIAEKRIIGGERVKQGDVLFIIDPRPFEAVVKQAEAEVASRTANLRLAQVTLTRVEEAVRSSAVSKLEQDKATADRDAATAQLELANAALTQAKLNLEYTNVRAPVSGRIGINVPDPGQLVAESDLLATLMNLDSVYAGYTIDERTLRRLREQNANRRPGEDGRGELTVLLGYPDSDEYTFQGRFAKADIGVDASTGTLSVDAIFENPGEKLLPGMFVRIASVGGEKKVMLVPDVAVQADQAGRYVFIVGAGDKVERRNVTVGPRVQRARSITGGLEPADRVIINGIQRCRPGAEVKPTETAALAPQG